MKAFPNPNTEINPYLDPSLCREGGMDLRDFFAAHAMQAMLRIDPDKFFQLYQDKYPTMLEGVADIAFQMSDEMMKRRTK